MLKFYFSSIIIWWIILLAIRTVTINSLVNNGWVDKNKIFSFFKIITLSFFIACIPFVRFFRVLCFIIGASLSKEQWNQMIEEAKKEIEEENNNK